MNAINETLAFANWLGRLDDAIGKARVLARIMQAKAGNFGDHRPVGDGVSEMRVHAGPGYRVYYAQTGRRIYLLILGGVKSNQAWDIRKAKTLWRALREAGA